MRSYAQFVPVISLTLVLIGIACILLNQDYVVGVPAFAIGAVGLISLAITQGRSRKKDDQDD